MPARPPGAPRRPPPGRLRAVSPARRTELVVLLVLYVVPLTAALVLLVAAGLGQLALGLAVVEVVVIAAVVWAKRTSP